MRSPLKLAVGYIKRETLFSHQSLLCARGVRSFHTFLAHLSRRLKWAIVIARCPSSGVNIFDFSSETTEQILTKLDRKQELNVLYQVCVFCADPSSKMAALASDWLKYFWLLLPNHWMDFDETLYQVCVFRADRKSKMAALASDWLKHFSTYP